MTQHVLSKPVRLQRILTGQCVQVTIVSNTLLSDRTTVTAWLTQIDDTSLPYFYRCRHLFATITRTKNTTITRLTRSKALAISIRKAPNGKAVGDENVPSYLYSAFQSHFACAVSANRHPAGGRKPYVRASVTSFVIASDLLVFGASPFCVFYARSYHELGTNADTLPKWCWEFILLLKCYYSNDLTVAIGIRTAV